MSLGITLVGHQKKIMSSIQTMRAQMLHLHGTGVQVWRTATGRIGQGENKNRTYLEQCLGHNRDNCQSKRTSVMSDSSGCVWSEIIPLFLSEGLQSASSKGTWERKRAKKRNYLDETTPFFCLFFILFFLEALMNSTTYQMAHWTGVWLLRFFNLMNDLSAHHDYGFPLKRSKKQPVYLRWFHLFLFLIC